MTELGTYFIQPGARQGKKLGNRLADYILDNHPEVPAWWLSHFSARWPYWMGSQWVGARYIDQRNLFFDDAEPVPDYTWEEWINDLFDPMLSF